MQSGQTAHLQPIQRPIVSQCLDFEGEMAVIMGEGGKHIKPEDALKYIIGYSCYNESTIRAVSYTHLTLPTTPYV